MENVEHVTYRISGTPEAQAEFWAAFARSQSKFRAVKRTHKGQAGNQTFYYAPMEVILDACLPALNGEGLALMQPMSRHGEWHHITTILAGHGALLESEYRFVFEGSGTKADGTVRRIQQVVQDLGAMLTYVRRYAVKGVLMVESDQDPDDAGEPPPRRQERRAEAPDELVAEAKELAAKLKSTGLSYHDVLAKHFGLSLQQVKDNGGWTKEQYALGNELVKTLLAGK